MNPVAMALGYGHSALEILNFLSQSNPKLKKDIKKALNQGYKPEDIAAFLSGKKSGEQQAFSKSYTPTGGQTQKELTAQAQNAEQPLFNLPNAEKLATTAAGAYLGGQVFGSLGSMVGNYVSSKLNERAAKSASQPQPTGIGQTNKQAPSTNVSGTVKQVASLFGFKNKTLVDAISKVAEQTGQDVQTIYEDLKKNNDLSTPEKAAQAAQTRLNEIVGKGDELPKNLGTVKTHEETLKTLTKDLKSAVVKRTDYDPKTRQAKVIFNNNHSYVYNDVPEDAYESLVSGSTAAKTSGQNEFGRWWVGKNPSLGASLNAFKKQGYQYNRVEDYEPSEQEEKQYRKIAAESKRAHKKYESGAEKAAAASKSKIEGREPLTKEQIRLRRVAANKEIEQLSGRSREEKDKGILDVIEKRLQELDQLDKLRGLKKAKVLTEETMRFEKMNGLKILKKMMTRLPQSLAKVIKDKIGKVDEKELLDIIQKYLKK